MAFIKIDSSGVVLQKQPYFEDGFVEAPDNVVAGMVQQPDGSYTVPHIPDGPVPVPLSVSSRQCRLELRAAGILALVPQIIAAIPDDGERQDAEIEWEFASMVERTNPLIDVIRVATNKTAAEIDDMFRRAIKR